MKENVGSLDRAIRIAIGVILIVLAATGVIGWWGWIGVVPVATGWFKYCPIYPLFGINSCPAEKELEFHEKQK
ncbi:MAG: hypothetical protein H6R19_305 [Proteobacteria bacterium]|nr:hypothetical protein [Pseudomonadota bacterium]